MPSPSRMYSPARLDSPSFSSLALRAALFTAGRQREAGAAVDRHLATFCNPAAFHCFCSCFFMQACSYKPPTPPRTQPRERSLGTVDVGAAINGLDAVDKPDDRVAAGRKEGGGTRQAGGNSVC